MQSNVLVEGRVLDMSSYIALHHRASIVVFDIAQIAWLRQVLALTKSLLAKVLNSIVISIGQEVMQLLC